MTAYNKNFILLILLYSLTTSIGYSREVKKHFYFLGGGGEPNGETTIFDNDVKVISGFINSPGWETTVSFNGGHKKTEEIIKTKLPKVNNAGPFIEANYNKLIKEMTDKINNGTLADGDQLMISIDTHGGKKGKENTHKISLTGSEATNLNTLAGAKTVDLDKLQALIDLAAAKGVKLAVIDMSCFSGNLLNLKTNNACLISATGKDQYGWAGTIDLSVFSITSTFSGKFFDLLKKGRNLEDIFLGARTKGWTPDFPMISTEEGQAVEALLYHLMVPYLNFNDKYGANLDTFYYTNNKEKFEQQVCELDHNHKGLQVILDQFQHLSRVSNEAGQNEFDALKKALDTYRNYQKEYEESLRGKLEADQEIKSILIRDYAKDKKLWEDYVPTSFLITDFEGGIKRTQQLYDEATNAYVKKMWKDSLESMKRQIQIVSDVKTKLSQVTKNNIKRRDDVYAKSGRTKGMATNVAAEAKKVYDVLYRNNKKSATNPCRDFIL